MTKPQSDEVTEYWKIIGGGVLRGEVEFRGQRSRSDRGSTLFLCECELINEDQTQLEVQHHRWGWWWRRRKRRRRKTQTDAETSCLHFRFVNNVWQKSWRATPLRDLKPHKQTGLFLCSSGVVVSPSAAVSLWTGSSCSLNPVFDFKVDLWVFSFCVSCLRVRIWLSQDSEEESQLWL